jgi:hypothetical protein
MGGCASIEVTDRDAYTGGKVSRPGRTGAVVPAVVTVATANPVGLIVSGAVKVYGEESGKTTIEGTARDTAEKIGEVLREAYEKQGWI